MQTFNVTFPQETRVNVLFGLCFSVFAICIVGFIWDFNHTNAIGLYFLTAGLLSSIAPLAAVITFKNYFTFLWIYHCDNFDNYVSLIASIFWS